LFFVQNYLPGYPFHLTLSHTWTLAVEEHFYFFLPALFALLISRRSDNPFDVIPMLCVFIAATCFLLRTFSRTPYTVPWATHARADELFGGVTLGYLYHFKPAVFRKLTGNHALVFAAVLLLSGYLASDGTIWRMQALAITRLGLGFFFLVGWSVTRKPKSKLMQAILGSIARIGVFSYSIYLWQTIIAEPFKVDAPTSLLKFCTYMTSCVVFGIVMSYLVEIPYLKLRDRLLPFVKPLAPTEAQTTFSTAGARSTND
jgi:peptidoglycan/LPS O-acetylase OafA/YrhL